VIVNALLDNDTLWTNEALDQLVESVVSQLDCCVLLFRP
jgi:hypothetical protein